MTDLTALHRHWRALPPIHTALQALDSIYGGVAFSGAQNLHLAVPEDGSVRSVRSVRAESDCVSPGKFSSAQLIVRVVGHAKKSHAFRATSGRTNLLAPSE